MNKFFLKILLILLIIPSSCSEFQIEKTDEDWSFTVFGDLRGGYGIYNIFAYTISNLEPLPKFSVCLGDLMNTKGNEAEWENFWINSTPITDKMPLYITRGNHEGNDEFSEQVFKEQTGITSDIFYYSFTYEKTLFIVLDSYIKNEEKSIGPNQFNWLKIQLDISHSDSINNVFIFLHHPIYPQGIYQGDDLKNADQIHSLFLLYSKIRAVFMSHEHSFNKYIKDNIVYITSGGAGAPLYRGYGGDYHHFVKVSYFELTNTFNLKTIGIFNETIEDFNL